MNFVDQFNNREKALLIWGMVFLIWVIFHRDSRRALFGVFKALFNVQILIPLIFLLLYLNLIIALFYRLQVWDSILVKDTVVWFLFTGCVLFININKANKDELFFKHMLIDSIKFTIALEFIANFYTFSLVGEFILLPLLFVLFGMKAIAETRENTKSLKKVLDFIVGIIGILLGVFVLINLIKDFQSLTTIDNLHSLLLPSLLTLAHIPFFYFLALYTSYDSLFRRITIFLRNDEDSVRFAKHKILLLCHVNLKKLNKFSSKNHVTIMKLRGMNDVMNLFRDFER